MTTRNISAPSSIERSWGGGALLLCSLPPLPPQIENDNIATVDFQDKLHSCFMNEYGAHKPKVASGPFVTNYTTRAMRKALKSLNQGQRGGK